MLRAHVLQVSMQCQRWVDSCDHGLIITDIDSFPAVVKGCGDCVLNNASIPNFACANGWRFCANCTDREKCNGDGISARRAAGVGWLFSLALCWMASGLWVFD